MHLDFPARDRPWENHEFHELRLVRFAEFVKFVVPVDSGCKSQRRAGSGGNVAAARQRSGAVRIAPSLPLAPWPL
ncbi:MAG TPA: hypothetical protein VM241_07425, partial [Candidatus Thermoplasmatota archaeon]|nr:hypothetical protein [Candidatus Thermoplasmatota archaeon]